MQHYYSRRYVENLKLNLEAARNVRTEETQRRLEAEAKVKQLEEAMRGFIEETSQIPKLRQKAENADRFHEVIKEIVDTGFASSQVFFGHLNDTLPDDMVIPARYVANMLRQLSEIAYGYRSPIAGVSFPKLKREDA